ncbi:MAG: GNAT family N-acetyltransferase [Alphaproteobacteria bacterium]|nr:MAG: GNAT family N-acetyltransferase [Alphaproteobacteria bacterium]
MTLAIRPVAPADEADWRRMWRGYLDFYEASVDDEVYRESFRRLLSGKRGEFQGLVAEQDGMPAGLVHFLFHRHMWRTEDVCYLQDLWVEPAFRGMGIGRALIEAVYRTADARGCPRVYWLTQEHNATARRLYDRIGRKSPFIRYDRP